MNLLPTGTEGHTLYVCVYGLHPESSPLKVSETCIMYIIYIDYCDITINCYVGRDIHVHVHVHVHCTCTCVYMLSTYMYMYMYMEAFTVHNTCNHYVYQNMCTYK